MSFWISLWGWVLLVALALFAGVAVFVTIGGLGDLREMFRRIDAQHGKRNDEAE